MTFTAKTQSALEKLLDDVRSHFGDRFIALVVYGLHARTSAPSDRSPNRDKHAVQLVNALLLVTDVRMADLSWCASKASSWSRQGLATPFVLTRDEFRRSLDVFPFEYGDIIAHHVVVAGDDPFDGLALSREDLRRACEVQAKGHLIHLREGFIEAEARPSAVANLITVSAAPFRALLARIAQLQGADFSAGQLAEQARASIGLDPALVNQILTLEHGGRLLPNEALALYERYLDAAERLWRFADQWRGVS